MEISKVRQAFLESSTAANMLGLNMQNLVHVNPDLHVDLSSFGQELRQHFTKDLYVSRLNYGILLLVLSGCLAMTFLIHRLAKTLVRLAKSLSDLAQLNAGLEQKVTDRTRALASDCGFR